MNEQILAAIVTYGEEERFDHLKIGVERLNSIDVIYKIIIIDNGSQYNVKSKLAELQVETPIDFYHNDKNEGSAGGFGRVFEISRREENYTRLLILDDDSLLGYDALESVFNYEVQHRLTGNYIWSLYRPVKYPDTFQKKWDWNENYLKNRIVGISIQQQLFGKFQKTDRRDQDLSEPLYAPYAGMLINKNIVDGEFYPDQSYYLYVDDIDYSIQLRQAGVKIFQIEKAKIEDLEGSWGTKKHGMQSYFTNEENGFRYLYNVRNWIYMIKTRGYIRSATIFKVNLILYHVLALVYMPKNKKGILKYKRLRSAVKDGLTGNMGYMANYFN